MMTNCKYIGCLSILAFYSVFLWLHISRIFYSFSPAMEILLGSTCHRLGNRKHSSDTSTASQHSNIPQLLSSDHSANCGSSQVSLYYPVRKKRWNATLTKYFEWKVGADFSIPEPMACQPPPLAWVSGCYSNIWCGSWAGYWCKFRFDPYFFSFSCSLSRLTLYAWQPIPAGWCCSSQVQC